MRVRAMLVGDLRGKDPEHGEAVLQPRKSGGAGACGFQRPRRSNLRRGAGGSIRSRKTSAHRRTALQLPTCSYGETPLAASGGGFGGGGGAGGGVGRRSGSSTYLRMSGLGSHDRALWDTAVPYEAIEGAHPLPLSCFVVRLAVTSAYVSCATVSAAKDSRAANLASCHYPVFDSRGSTAACGSVRHDREARYGAVGKPSPGCQGGSQRCRQG